MDVTLFIHSLVDEHLLFLVGAIIIKLDMHVQLCRGHVFISLRYIPRRGIAGSKVDVCLSLQEITKQFFK